jgi:hypothetical protein
MIQGKEKLSLAHRAASGTLGVARTILVAAAAIAFSLTTVTNVPAAAVRPPVPAGPGGSSGTPLPNPLPLEDAIIVGNYGAIEGGSWQVYPAGQKGGNFKPSQYVTGPNTVLVGPTGIVEGPATLVFPVFVGLFAANGVFGYAPSSNGNNFPLFTFVGPGTGLNAPFGVTTGNTEGLVTELGTGLWVTNGLVEVFASPPLGAPCSVGTITTFDPALPGVGQNPLPTTGGVSDNVVFQQNGAPSNVTIGGCTAGLLFPVGIAVHNLAVDDEVVKSQPDQVAPDGIVYVVNFGVNATAKHGKTPASPALNGYLLAFNPGLTGYGDVSPIGAFGAPGQPGTQNILFKPEYIALTPGEEILATAKTKSGSIELLGSDLLAVTDIQDNSIKFFEALESDIGTIGFTFIGSIVGSQTRLHTPMGIAVGLSGDTYYVSNQSTNAVTMYDLEDGVISTGMNFPPSTIIQGSKTLLNQPTGMAIDTALEP